MKSTEHITLVAVLHIAWSLLLLVAGCVVFVLSGAGGLLAGEDELAYVAVAVATLATTLLFITAAAGLVGAYGLLKRRSWGRFTLMVLSAVWLIKIPVGTAMGIYSFYVLTRVEIVEEFRQVQG